MIHFDSTTAQVLFYILAAVVAALLLFIGYRLGQWLAGRSAARRIAAREQELFVAQKGFKTLYEREVQQLGEQNSILTEKLHALEERVEQYRRKAAGFGGLFRSGKRAEAMYALLLENEALEEALSAQNDKLRQERLDALKEQQRATGYRRVLISHLLRDDRVRGYAREVLADERHLPDMTPPPSSQLPKQPGEP